MNKKEVDIDKLIDGYYESNVHQYYSQKGEGQASANAALSLRMKAGLARKRALLSNKVGAHIKGGKASISKLLEWQKENDHSIGDIAKNKDDNWKQKIGKGNKGKTRSAELREHLSNTINEKVSKMSSEEKNKKFSNDSSTRKAIRVHTQILNMIPNDVFNTSDAKKACQEYGLGNWKGFLKNKKLIQQLHKGTNQNNPSIYKKIGIVK